ncbi:MAG: uroporphyrinogen decarboxylase [Bacteriovoracaceae bacterium]|nr:uroporphyrinogen decarboxylase [Bacteriovoracaceae bacterium]
MGLFQRQKTANGKTQVPVWFMRQAGRYHEHYQNIKKNSDFMTMCKNPELACEITMGPIQDFKFDAAILFSDLLFPLEQLGMGLSYISGPPTLKYHIKNHEDFKQLKLVDKAENFYAFQNKALTLLKKTLPAQTDLLGFVGAPFTLYAYAVEGGHSGNLVSSKKGLYDGRFQAFMEILLPQLLANMDIQAKANPTAVCLFDTAAGELALSDYQQFIVPVLRQVCETFKKQHPHTKIIYYSKFTHLHFLEILDNPFIDVLGVDWRMDLSQALKTFSKNYYIQGNIDPAWLHLPWAQLEKNLAGFFKTLEKNNVNFEKWICGLGHGVLIETPQDNVRKTVEFIHKNFIY